MAEEDFYVTPEVARSLLKKAAPLHQRLGPSRGKMQALERAMKSNTSRIDGSGPMRFGRDGNVINGHHRLELAVKHNISFWTKVRR